MTKNDKLYWETKTLAEMTVDEWEFLCDGCGICCLQKIEDQDTGNTIISAVSCLHLDIKSCQCKIYNNRAFINSDCIKLTPDKLEQITWLPETCAYRMIHEKKLLEWWHPLISGNPETVHSSGISIRNKAVSGEHVHPDDIDHYLL